MRLFLENEYTNKPELQGNIGRLYNKCPSLIMSCISDKTEPCVQVSLNNKTELCFPQCVLGSLEHNLSISKI